MSDEASDTLTQAQRLTDIDMRMDEAVAAGDCEAVEDLVDELDDVFTQLETD